MSPFEFTSMPMPITSVVGGDFILEIPAIIRKRAAVSSRAAYDQRGEDL